MENLKIDKTKAKSLYKEASKEFKVMLEDTFGKDYFSDKITDKIKTWEDVCEILNINSISSLPYKNPKNKQEKSLNALFKIQKISEVLNEGWVENWCDDNQYKYYPYFNRRVSSGWVMCSYRCNCYDGVLSFGSYYKSSDLALFAGTQFIDIYIDYLPE